ncbi:MAG: prepilin-type N-terminal cleavage/methylation domain-containing protein [Bacilli bacterium]|nr:prepilin-type N-terminal cleavage/methylation domain-containing protein [Bacilli bacterium]
MKKRGFTLVELLAVIIVLAIIALIAYPVLIGVIENSRKTAVRDSAYGLIDSADLYFASKSNSTFICDGDKCINNKNVILSLKGSVPLEGEIISGSNSELRYIKLDSYCVLGNKQNLDIQKNCEDLDVSAPDIDISNIGVTSKSIILNINLVDKETGIKSIKYEIDGKEYIDNYDSKDITVTKVFDKLKAGKEYTIKVTATNGKKLSRVKEFKVSTLKLGTLKVKFNNTPSTSQLGYFKTQVAYLDYDSNDAEGYYIKTEKEATSNVASIKSCGSNNSPSNCIVDSTKSLQSNKWYYFETSPKITYNKTKDEENTIYARVTNGVSITGNSTATVSKIDRTSPTVTLENITVTSKSISIPIISYDAHSGLGKVTCKYSTADGKYSTNASSVTTSNCTINNIVHNTTYYYQVCVSDKVGNTSTCKTGNSKTTALTLALKATNTPSTAQNGYLKTQVWNLNITGNPNAYYVKSTSDATSSVNLTKSCGTDTNPGSCTSITSTKNMSSNTWYYTTSKPTVTYNKTSDENATLYARISDGKNTTSNASATVSKIDATSPTLSLGTVIVTSKSIVIPITSSDINSGINTVTCKYSTTSGSYTTNASSATTDNCTISNVKHNTTYYYQVCVSDKVGNNSTCKTGSSKTTALTVALKATNTPTTSQNEYFKTQVWNLDTTGNPNAYYVKSTSAATSSVNLTKSCGTDTNPGSCTNITATKSMAANTWYYTTSKPTVTYNSTNTETATLYARISDGKNTTTNASATVSKIDATSPTATIGGVSVTSNSIVIPITSSDEHSGLGTVTCKYSTTDGTYSTNASSVTTSNCTISNITHNTTYYYQVCVSDKVGNNSTCKTGSSKTTALTVALKATNTPSTAQNGYLKSQVWNLTTSGNPNAYYIKSTSAATSSVNLTKSCGTSTNPGSCTNITATKSMAANTWYYTTSKPSITYNKTNAANATLYARISDGKNTTGNASATVSKIDATSPTVTLGNATVTSKSISIPITSSDANSGLNTVTCKYSTTSGSYTTNASSVTTSNCTISNITHNTTYYYQFCINDKVGNGSTCKTGSAKTTQLSVALSSSNSPSSAVNGYYKSQVWNLTTSGNPTGYYVRTTRSATSSVNLTKSCGTSTNPGTCSNITSTKSMVANTWYYTTSKPSITYNTTSTSTSTLYARITDGKNTTGNASATVSKIDVTAPSKPSIQLVQSTASNNTTWGNGYSSGAWTNKSVLTRSKSTDTGSGVKYYQYSHDGKSWTADISTLGWQTAFYENKTIFDYWITWEGQWNFYIRAVDNLGNASAASNMFTIRIDKTNPTIPEVWPVGSYTTPSTTDFRIYAVVKDALSGLGSVSIGGKNVPLSDISSAGNAGADIPYYGKGSTTVYIIVYDKAGNKAETSTVLIRSN